MIHLRPRLELVAQYLDPWDTVADVGCDHGRLSVALLQRDHCRHLIASDVNKDPLQRARALRDTLGLQERMELRLGSGLSVLAPGEAQGVVMAGMGGTLMCQLLEECLQPLQGAQQVVLQPMRAQEDIRRYLFEKGYIIIKDGIVEDAGRFYQVFSFRLPQPGETITLPEGWPEDCFDLGYQSLVQKDPLLPVLARQMLWLHEKNLQNAAGVGAEVLKKKVQHMQRIIALWEERSQS